MRPGGKLEIVSEELEAGQTVDVVVLHESGVTGGRSIMEILNSGPERRLFQDSRRSEGPTVSYPVLKMPPGCGLQHD